MEFTEFLGGRLDLFHQQVVKVADQFASGDLTPEEFRQGFKQLKGCLDQLGAATFVALVEQADEQASEIIHNGSIYRHKQPSVKEWLTPWGKVKVRRRLYQADRGGRSYIPLDHRCGMVDRFMTADIEEVCVLLSASLVPAEVEQALSGVYPDAPSRKAIQNAQSKAGGYLEAHCEDLETTLAKTAPLNTLGDILVAGWDGTNVPVREPAPKRGRPAERPGVGGRAQAGHSDQGVTAWKEAGLGMVAVYQTPLDPTTQDAERLDVRYFARMPEPKMARIVEQVSDQTKIALLKGSFEHKVFIADGKREIWTTVEDHPLLGTFTPILDFYHMAEHLSLIAEALFGKKTQKAQDWYERCRHKLLEQPGAVHNLLRSLKRYRQSLRKGSPTHRLLTREIGYFRTNQHKMDYVAYRAEGLPIGSGPIEAACKTIVGHRLKRSGMRWHTKGGQEVLNLRAPLKSNRWQTTWNWYLTHSTKLTNAA